MRGLATHLGFILLLPLLTFGCDSDPLVLDPFPLEAGIWSSDEARLEITETGGEIVFPCARGTFDAPIMVHRGGTFEAEGIMVSGPVAVTRRPVRYEGRIVDETMTLTIAYTDTPEAFGTFELIEDFDSGVGYICVC